MTIRLRVTPAYHTHEAHPNRVVVVVVAGEWARDLASDPAPLLPFANFRMSAIRQSQSRRSAITRE